MIIRRQRRDRDGEEGTERWSERGIEREIETERKQQTE